MQRRLATSGLFLIAFAAAMGFTGEQLSLYALSSSALVTWLITAIVRRNGTVLPRTLLAYSLGGLITWYALTLIWASVPYSATLGFWWMSALPLAFFGFLWDPESRRAWPQIQRAILLLGALSTLFALFQLTEGEAPRSLFLNKNNHAALLNLILLPLGAHFLTKGKAHGIRDALLGVLVFIFAVGVFISGSRGAMLGFGIGVVVLLGLKPPLQRRWLTFAALIALAFLGAHLADAPQSPGARLATLASPGSAGATRFAIWSSSLEMLQESPWWGIGLGSFWLTYPAFRAPHDASGGYFVHNDYLQIWLEAGLPGILLFLTASLALLLAIFSSRRAEVEARNEIHGLGAGLVAIGVHSAFSYNFYLLSVLLLCGIYVGRIHQLLYPTPGGWRLSWPRVRRPLVLLGGAALVAAPVSHFASVAGAQYLVTRAEELTVRSLAESDRLLAKAQALAPKWEAVSVARGDLRLAALDELDGKSAREAYTAALQAYHRGHQLNPFLPRSLVGLARLHSEYPVLSGAEGASKAETFLAEALAHSPRNISARRNLAFHRLRSGDPEGALAVLEGGLVYWEPPTVNTLNYYLFAAQLYAQLGISEKADVWRLRAMSLKRRLEERGRDDE